MIRGYLRMTAILFLTIAGSVGTLVAGAFGGRPAAARVMRWWGRAFLRAGGWTVATQGADNLPREGAILVANHQSLVDIPLLVAAFDREIRFLAKKELGRIPVFGRSMRVAGNLFVDREDPRDAVRVIREAGNAMRRGEMIVIFPEGTRSEDGSIGEFKPGAFFIARKTGAPLVPVYIEGGIAALPKGAIVARPASLVARVLPPMKAAGTALSLDGMAAEARRRIAAAREDEARRAPAPSRL
ncbi:MAG: lysophospholipid acyltransferase family protein [Gemmatimonadota bacterium]